MNAKPTIIIGSEVHSIKSMNTGRTYRISVSLPYAYSSNEDTPWPFNNPLEKWPVVYLLDANWHFGMITDMVRSMSWYGTTAEAIIVGIGYEEGQDLPKNWINAVIQRAIDFTPARNEVYEKTYGDIFNVKILTGDAFNFHRFIKEELISFIEDKYNTDPSRRILAGQSLGGLFGAFALLHEPELFDKYIIGSPYLGYDGNNFMPEFEEKFSSKNNALNAKAYFTIGENEEMAGDPMVGNYVKFVANLESRNYKGFTMHKKIFNNLNHTEVICPGFQAGLNWALQK